MKRSLKRVSSGVAEILLGGDFLFLFIFIYFYFFIKCMQPMAMALSRRCVCARLHVIWPKSMLYTLGGEVNFEDSILSI